MKINRRRLLAAGVAGALTGATGPVPAAATGDATLAALPAPRNLLWYDKPAAQWVEALPVGNGRQGAMVFGGVKRERLQLNEDTLWSGGPYRNVNPQARAALPVVRQLIFDGRYAEAETYADAHVQAVPMREMSFQSIGDLWLDLHEVDETSASDYRRELDLDAAVCRTAFVAGGVRYSREVIASYPDDIIAIAVRAEGGPLALDLSLSSGQRVDITAGAATIVMRGVNNAEHGIDGRLRFEARLEAGSDGGTITADGPVLRLRGGQSALIRLAMATSYRGPEDVGGDPSARTQAALQGSAGKSFEALRQAHGADYGALFKRQSLDLPAGKGADQPTGNRVEHGGDREDPSLAALYFQFGRYLLISSSRPGTQPANLQGIWNESNTPPWGSKFTININTEMNYWPADTANLSECVEPLLRMVEELAASGERTARDMYGARGWVAHHNTDAWRASGPVDHMQTGLWPTGGAWLCNQLWDHYDYTRDPRTLERLYPLMRGSAVFFLDTLVKDPHTGYMVTNPSLSPENNHGRGSTLCAGPTLDNQLLRDLFTRTGMAAGRLNADAGLRRDMAAMTARLVPNTVGSQGQLQEWQADWDAGAADIHHRHTSHLYGLFPSQQINLDDTPALAQAARVSLRTRGDEATGWGLGWRLNLWAHLRDGDHAHAILKRLISRDRTYPNLFDAHPPFQIDGNFGGVRGITEMLIQSRGDIVHVLPALPSAWPDGALRGVRLRGAVEADLLWKAGTLDGLTLRADQAGTRELRLGGRKRVVELAVRRPLTITAEQFA